MPFFSSSSSFFLFFFIILAINIFIFIKVSGWDKLATKYGYPQPFTGSVAWMSTAYIGSIRFRNCIGIGISPKGLYLNPFVLFRVSYPPILVPWQEVSRFEIRKGVFGLGQYYVLDIGFPRIRTVKLPSRVFSKHPEIVQQFTESR